LWTLQDALDALHLKLQEGQLPIPNFISAKEFVAISVEDGELHLAHLEFDQIHQNHFNVGNNFKDVQEPFRIGG
jgi:hypothetical protein